ncbi:hypothetical protein [Pontibacter rugosus]|uniref:Lipocalin-like domain-containing protein n=1 Tax=Pontibacter rugosus TaxID=1745966 RepID=A0ABW3SX88_9BACT
MKKLLLFFLPVLLLSACNKDDEGEIPTPIPEGEISQKLQGKWTNKFIVREYYGDADTIVYADSVEVQSYFEFKGNQMFISLPGSTNQEAYTYDLPKKDEPNYITFKRGSLTTDYTVLAISDTSMVWLDEQAYAGYPIDVPDDKKKTSKVGKFTYRFVKDK